LKGAKSILAGLLEAEGRVIRTVKEAEKRIEGRKLDK